jgi:hypothetical protein
LSWFTTTDFSFELPGEAWEERSLQLLVDTQDGSTILIAREPFGEGGLRAPLEVLVNGAIDPAAEREVLGYSLRQIGPLDAEEARVIVREDRGASYFRFMTVGYYELVLCFGWTGLAPLRREIDARAESFIESLEFRKR